MSEIRDPVHGFIRFDDLERALIDSPALQRLKYIHQLALSYLVYPGATHSRFEHSLGTMELAGRAFDAIARNDPNLTREVFGSDGEQQRWRATVRVAGLLHDVGHPPFSHAGDTLFSGGVKNHEEMTRRIILSEPLTEILGSTGTYRLNPDEVAFIASGIGIATNQAQLVAKELITGDLGVDRMDYLRRDSQACGVSYGLYDLPRMVETLVLARTGEDDVTLGLEQGGLYAAEGLLTARYFMFSQVYFHDIRVAYDEHLIRFLQEYLPGGCYPDGIPEYQDWDDVKALGLLRDNASNSNAQAILGRRHYRLVREFLPRELGASLNFVETLRGRLDHEFGQHVFVTDSRKSTRSFGLGQVPVVFPDRVVDILAASATLDAFKPMWFVRVFSSLDSRTEVLKVVESLLATEEAQE